MSLVAITPAYNEEEHIREVAESVLNQTYPVKRYVIIDDRSTDRTYEIIEEIGSEKITVIPSGRTTMMQGSRSYGRSLLAVVQVGVNYLDRHEPQWKYQLHHDADIVIPPDYCQLIIQTMDLIPSLVMAGAKWLNTGWEIEETPPLGVRNATHIIRRGFYRYCQSRGYDYNNLHGEILLERIAWANGFVAMPIPAMVKGLRPTTEKKDPPFRKGVEYYQTGRPLLTFLMALRRGVTHNRIKLISGWLHARLSSNYQDYFSKTERSVLRKCFYRQHIANLRKRLTRSSKFSILS